MQPHQSSPRPYLPILLILFVGSGCAALIYEIVWFQLLQLAIGSSAVSLGALLGTFMGGMCLGSILLPKKISTRHHPLRVYAYLELGIGVLGLLVLWAIPVLDRVYAAVASIGLQGVFLRAVVAAICLLPPTLLMGASLPAIARWIEATPSGISWLGFFYGGNIAGAVFGSLIAGFYLLRVYDMAFTTYTAVFINAAVGGLALLLARSAEYTPSEAAATSAPVRATDAKTVYLVIGISGMCALGAEVVWTRLLAVMMGATVYTFSVILAVFLVGLGIGSSIGALLARSIARPRVALGTLPVSGGRRRRMDRLHAGRFDSLLAGELGPVQQPVVHLPDRSGAQFLGRAARDDHVGRELSSGARGRGRAGRRSRTPGRRNLRGEYRRRDPRRAGVQHRDHTPCGDQRCRENPDDDLGYCCAA